MKALGDAMAKTVAYDSLLGYELYPVHGATEDWNYIEQGSFGYTIEMGPGDASPLFQGPYQTHVVDQYLGGPSGGGTGQGPAGPPRFPPVRCGRPAGVRPGCSLRIG